MTELTPTIVDSILDEFKASMQWAPDTPALTRTLVLGNLNGFAAKLRSHIIDEASYTDLRASGGIVGAPQEPQDAP